MLQEDGRIADWRSGVRGFIGGSFLIGSIILDQSFPIRVGLFIVGVFILIDALIPRGEEPYILTALIAAVIGALASVGTAATNNIGAYLVVVLIIAVLYYLESAYRYARR